MTRDDIRQILKDLNITCENVTPVQLLTLRDTVNKHLKLSNIYDGSAKLDKTRDQRYMTMNTNQWKGREAISFNKDGFIGIAGWAGDSNAAPLVSALHEWSSLAISDIDKIIYTL